MPEITVSWARNPRGPHLSLRRFARRAGAAICEINDAGQRLPEWRASRKHVG